MSQSHILFRTEKLRALKALLEEKQIIYISSFFYSGKTLLLQQLEARSPAPVLRFDGMHTSWQAFAQRVEATPNALLLLDDIDRLPDDGAWNALCALLSAMSANQRAVLTGRAQLPAALRRLCACGAVQILDKDFTMFTEEEIEQLFLSYELSLTPVEIRLIKQRSWGWAFSLHALAQKRLKEPLKPVSAILDECLNELKILLITDVVQALPEQERALLYSLSPFDRFTDDMARMVTGRADAPAMMRAIAEHSHMLFREPGLGYRFVPFVREALFSEMRNLYSQDYINGQYKRAALYYELQNQVPKAIECYTRLYDTEKIRELLIRDTHFRPSNGDYVELRYAYALLSESTLKSSPELMKGICMIESLLGHAQEGERWYQALRDFIRATPQRDPAHRAAEEAVAYLDICLPQRGSRNTLNTLIATAKMRAFTQSDSWSGGFNVGGNSVSLMNGGKDFCRWVPHGWQLYRLLKSPIELALGRGGRGMGDIAIGECELESSLSGDYTLALEKVLSGLSACADDLEMRCAATGIQSRILAAQGNAPMAIQTMDRLLATLPPDAPGRLVQNLNVHRLSLKLLLGDTEDAMKWLSLEAPDETDEFIILDRYRYMLKLRLYIIRGQWQDTPLLFAKLAHYFESYDRPYMRAQLHLLQAIALRRSGEDGWLRELEAAFAIARKYHLARVIADEGIGIVDMVNAMPLPSDQWTQGVLRLLRRQAARYPLHMRQIAVRPVFTDREYQVYSLMIAGYKNAKIASILNITERTVKHYTAEIYQKLNVSTRAEAINRAAELGDIR